MSITIYNGTPYWYNVSLNVLLQIPQKTRDTEHNSAHTISVVCLDLKAKSTQPPVETLVTKGQARHLLGVKCEKNCQLQGNIGRQMCSAALAILWRRNVLMIR